MFGIGNKIKAKPEQKAAVPNAASRLLSTADTMQKYNQYFTERTITPPTIQSAIDIYRSEGKLQYLANVMNLLIDSDENLQSKILVRKSPLNRAIWKYGKTLSPAQEEFYNALITNSLADWVETFMEGKLMGHQFQQIMWEFDGKLYTPAELVTYSNIDLRIANRKLGFYENNKPVELPQYKFVNMLYRRPTLHSLLKYYVFYIYAINHWAQFVETYGKPQRIGKYDSLSMPNELDVLKKAVKNLGTDQSCIISKDMEIEFKDFSGKYGSQSLYKSLCDYVTGRVTNAILGQPLTTQIGENGSYALGEVQSDVQEDIVQSDIRDLSKYVNVILKYVDAINFGGSGISVEFDVFKPVNMQQRIEIDTKLRAIGLPMAEEYFYDTYNVPVPENGAKLVEALWVSEAVNADGLDSRLNHPTRQQVGVLGPQRGNDKGEGLDSRLNHPTRQQVGVLGPQRGNDRGECGKDEEGASACARTVGSEDRALQASARTVVSEDRALQASARTVGSEDRALQASARTLAKSLAKMQADIRACKTLKDLKEIDYWWFVRSMAGDLANRLADSYVDGRKTARKRGGKKLANVGLPTIRFEFDERSIETMNAFRSQAYIVSAVRTGQAFKQLWNDAAKALEEGGDFKEFINKANLAGFSPDNPYHLKTEFETAIAAAQQAGHWAEIEANADLFPYLRYVTMEDELVRPEHAVLNGTIAPIGDAFWEENYPPNGYNCRCDVEQLTEDEAKADPKWQASKETLTKDRNFSRNVGKTDKLPSDAFDKLWDYAQRAIDQLPNMDKLVNADGKINIVYDVNNWPIDVGASKDNAMAKAALEDPTEVWHNTSFETAYIKRMDDKVVIAKTEKGRLYWVYEIDQYTNQGRFGVMEYGQEK